jgi:hypothetical protein
VQELKELISSYQSQREGGRGSAICSSIISTARQCNMDKDCNLPPDEADTKEMALDDRDLIVGNVYRKCVLSFGDIFAPESTVALFCFVPLTLFVSRMTA